MKKLKLFLLGGLFTLIGVFNFSSAWDIEYSYSPWGDYIQRGLTCSFNNTEIYRRCCSDSSCSKTKTTAIKVSGNKKVESSVLCTDSEYPYLSNYILLNDGGPLLCYGTTDVMPVTALTPAIDGLHNTVVELIPYIVYIGIGVLLFTLGFYAIRRLVNWLSGKINSNFKSKR